MRARGMLPLAWLMLLLLAGSCGGGAQARPKDVGKNTRAPSPVTASGPAADQKVHRIFLLGGQSNMVGQGAARDLAQGVRAPDSEILYAFDTGGGRSDWAPLAAHHKEHGPEITLGHALVRGGLKVGLLKFAAGGSGLAKDWLGRRRLYRQARTFFKGELARYPHPYEVAGVFWVGGSADAKKQRTAAAYGRNLRALIDSFRTDFGPDLPFVICEVPTHVPVPFAGSIREQTREVAASVPGVFLVNVDDQPPGKDPMHMTSSTLQALGERAAAALLRGLPAAEPREQQQ